MKTPSNLQELHDMINTSARELRDNPPQAGRAHLVQRASAGGLAGGARGGSPIPNQHALLSTAGAVWQSPIPKTHEEAEFFNGAADRLNLASDIRRIYTRCPACHNDTLIINKGHLLCTWVDCKNPIAAEELINNFIDGRVEVVSRASISDERLSALVGFVYQGIRQISDGDRVEFMNALGTLFCRGCGRDLQIGETCSCQNDE